MNSFPKQKEDKLVTLSNSISLLDDEYKLKFCAYFLRYWKLQQGDINDTTSSMIGDVCKIIQMVLPSSLSYPRLIGNTIDQLNKFMDWSNDVLNLPINQEEEGIDDDGVNEDDNVNSNKVLDTSAYDHYLLSDDDDSMGSSSDSLEDDEEEQEEDDKNNEDDDESMEEKENIQDDDTLEGEEE